MVEATRIVMVETAGFSKSHPVTEGVASIGLVILLILRRSLWGSLGMLVGAEVRGSTGGIP